MLLAFVSGVVTEGGSTCHSLVPSNSPRRLYDR